VNLAGSNTITLHTSAGCNINTAGSQYGTNLQHSNCNQDNGNTGCGATTTTANAYGDSFNSIGGGVYAMQWESSGIYVWFFPRGNIPADITNGRPVTGNWGTPVVAFNGGSGCNIDSFFKNQNIIFDTTFCGDVGCPSLRHLQFFPKRSSMLILHGSGLVPFGEAAAVQAWGLVRVMLEQTRMHLHLHIGQSTRSRCTSYKRIFWRGHGFSIPGHILFV